MTFIWHCDDRILCSDLGPTEIFHGGAFPLEFARLNFAESCRVGATLFQKAVLGLLWSSSSDAVDVVQQHKACLCASKHTWVLLSPDKGILLRSYP
jgi:hypothetical protein